jgi:hypothetical protein
VGGQDESHTNLDGLQLERSNAVELARGALLAGRYEIERLLGRGGAGLVLRAHDRELREAVAIKVLRPDLGQASRWIERLAREVKLARQLRHPNVCRVFDFEKADGHVFIVMELATGGTLKSELESGAQLRKPLDARLADARAVAAGLAAIHEAGIAHRDVTPQNVLRMADGRLVVSDFGLATEVSQTTTSIHGGTVAYMAPEVVRGQRGTFLSDVWALGVVIHETVFGRRPEWSKPVGGTLTPPAEGRTLSRGERLAFSVCRACTDEDPSRRPRAAREVEQWLGGQRPVTGGRAGARRWLAIVGALALALGAGRVLVKRAAKARAVTTPARATSTSTTLQIVDESVDWTKTSKVLVTVDEAIRCLLLLPDRHTVRYVWGTPPRAMEVDIRTGKQRPSALVPEAYRYGCPQISPDRKRLLFQGLAADGSAQAFVSEHPDGRSATPVIRIADPSMSSEPRWAPDGISFIFDADVRHTGAFSMATRRAMILPEPTHDVSASTFKFVTERGVVLTALLGSDTEYVGLGWPSLAEETRFRLPGFNIDVAARGDRFIIASRYEGSRLLEVDPVRHRARAIGFIAHQSVREPIVVDEGVVFRSRRHRGDIWAASSDGSMVPLSHDGEFSEVSPCGDDYIATEIVEERGFIVRVDKSGRITKRLSTGPVDHSPTCGPGGATWYFLRDDAKALVGCDNAGCRTLATGDAYGFVVASPDGRRLLVHTIGNAGPTMSWMSSGGGPLHEIALTDAACSPGWSSNDRAWISHRMPSGFAWTETDVVSGRETGRVIPGTTNCSEGNEDPASPVDPLVRVKRTVTTQIRLVPSAALGM